MSSVTEHAQSKGHVIQTLLQVTSYCWMAGRIQKNRNSCSSTLNTAVTTIGNVKCFYFCEHFNTCMKQLKETLGHGTTLSCKFPRWGLALSVPAGEMGTYPVLSRASEEQPQAPQSPELGLTLAPQSADRRRAPEQLLRTVGPGAAVTGAAQLAVLSLTQSCSLDPWVWGGLVAGLLPHCLPLSLFQGI